jgi:hypothetical protein
MRVRGGGRRPVPFAVAVLVGIALAMPAGAGAATVVNGDFEAGSLSGWDVHRVTESGNWFAYKGTSEPIARERGKNLPQPPPQGNYAAITDELQAETSILSQDVTLAPGLSHRLSLLALYDSAVPIAIHSPDTFAVGESLLAQQNQQFRIDVMKPGAPLESLDPADILRTVFRTEPGDPTSLKPTWLTADLSAFAGQTVRLRIANVANEELFNAGVDAVSIASTKPGEAPPPLGSNRFTLGKVKPNRKNGTATLAVEVPGPGKVSAKGEGTLSTPPKAGRPKAHATKTKKRKKRQALIAPTTIVARKAGSVTLRLKPTAPAHQVLKRKHKLRVTVEVAFAPAGGAPRTATVPVVLKLAAPAPHRR